MKIIVITGPTGVGKTKLSIYLAKKLQAVIINADSMQVYQDMNIGTAKITDQEKEGIKHYLFDIKKPTEDYNIYQYQQDARNLLNKFQKENKNVILVGGSGLYLKSLLYDYQFKEEPTQDDFYELTNQQLLTEINKYQKTTTHLNNRKRLVRELNKLKNNNQITSNTNKKVYNFLAIGLTLPRDTLYDITSKRVDKMIEDGLISEVKQLYDKNINTKAIKTAIGYKELYLYFDNKITKEEAISLIKKNTRHFIKRQYTFFKHQMDINWLTVNLNNFNETINSALSLIQDMEDAN